MGWFSEGERIEMKHNEFIRDKEQHRSKYKRVLNSMLFSMSLRANRKISIVAVRKAKNTIKFLSPGSSFIKQYESTTPFDASGALHSVFIKM